MGPSEPSICSVQACSCDGVSSAVMYSIHLPTATSWPVLLQQLAAQKLIPSGSHACGQHVMGQSLHVAEPWCKIIGSFCGGCAQVGYRGHSCPTAKQPCHGWPMRLQASLIQVNICFAISSSTSQTSSQTRALRLLQDRPDHDAELEQLGAA